MGAQHTHRPFSTCTHKRAVIPDRVAPPPRLCGAGVHVTHLAGQHGLHHLCVLTGEHGASQTEDHAHCRQQHEQRHLESWTEEEGSFKALPWGRATVCRFLLFFNRIKNGDLSWWVCVPGLNIIRCRSVYAGLCDSSRGCVTTPTTQLHCQLLYV